MTGRPLPSCRTYSVGTIDPKMFEAARDAARAFGDVDPRAFAGLREAAQRVAASGPATASIAEGLRELQSSGATIPNALRDASKALEPFRAFEAGPVAETLTRARGDNKLDFMKSLGPSASVAARLRPPTIAEGFRALKLPTLGLAVAAALEHGPPVSVATLAAPTAETVRVAAELVDAESMQGIVGNTLDQLANLSPAERRGLEGDVLVAISGIGTLVAYLANNGRLELASICLALLASLISIYWRLTRTDD